MMRLLTLLLSLLSSSCNVADQNTSTEKNISFTSANLKGNWYLNEWTSAHTLAISDSTIFVDNSADTVFTLNYKVTDNILTTWTLDSSQSFNNKILLLTKDTLVLDGFVGDKVQLNYSRINKGFK